MSRPAIHSLTHELASRTRTDPHAAPGTEHTNYRIYLWSGGAHPASSHVHSFRCRATRRPQRHLDVAKAARFKMVPAAQNNVSYPALKPLSLLLLDNFGASDSGIVISNR